jgi:hypothetical protein
LRACVQGARRSWVGVILPWEAARGGGRQDAILADGLSNRAEIRHDELTTEQWKLTMAGNAHEVPSGVEFAGRLDIGGELTSSRNETSAAMCLRNIMAYASEPAMQPRPLRIM